MHKLGVHWIPAHNRTSDREYIKSLQPPCVLVVNPDVQQLADIATAAPGAHVILRDHPRSEQHDDMVKDPVGTGIRHAQEGARQVKQLRDLAASRNLPFPRTVYITGINEPHVWDSLGPTVQYNISFGNEAMHQEQWAALLGLGVGWPANRGKDTPPDWAPYAPLEAVIKRGGHVLLLHEYWDKEGPDKLWGWWAGRYEKCPFNVPIVIGECGIDRHVAVNLGEQYDARGWGSYLSPEQYAEQLWSYANRTDPRVFAVLPFTTDGAREWRSFDTETAHAAILARIPATGSTSTYVPVALNLPPSTPAEGQPGKAGETGLLWPADGPISQRFGENPQDYAKFGIPGHNGLDIAAIPGTPVRAVADGEVGMVEADPDYGKYVRVWHPQLKLHSFYAHLDMISTRQGAAVRQGDTLGTVGSTGNATGPHLHLEFRAADAAGGYLDITAGYGKGRFNPEVAFALLGQRSHV